MVLTEYGRLRVLQLDEMPSHIPRQIMTYFSVPVIESLVRIGTALRLVPSDSLR